MKYKNTKQHKTVKRIIAISIIGFILLGLIIPILVL